MVLCEFVVLYKPGKENFLADFLSRLNEETPVEDADEKDDYHDQLVASIEIFNMEQSTIETGEKTELNEIKTISDMTDDQKREMETLNINIISQVPTSENPDEYISYCQEQDKDEDIMWIKNLILKHEDKKPVITKFENEVRRMFYKEYNNLKVIEGLVYRSVEDREGFMKTQFVIPNQVTDRVIRQIHSSLYNAHLGRKKTTGKITERLYRPF